MGLGTQQSQLHACPSAGKLELGRRPGRKGFKRYNTSIHGQVVDKKMNLNVENSPYARYLLYARTTPGILVGIRGLTPC